MANVNPYAEVRIISGGFSVQVFYGFLLREELKEHGYRWNGDAWEKLFYPDSLVRNQEENMLRDEQKALEALDIEWVG